jgi:hypothetical protein
MKPLPFESVPWWMVVVCSGVGLAIYVIGFCLMARMGVVWGLLYAAYGVWMEWRLLSGSCRYCYYFGKRCGFGKGRICSWFLAKAPERGPSASQMSWRNLVPDFLVSLIPIGVGVVILIRSFSWPLLLLLFALVLLGSVGTGVVRGQVACKYCKQRELGCPAEQLFSKSKRE